MTGRGLTRARTALLTAALITAAGVVVALAPSDESVVDVVRVDGRVGEVLTGRVQTVRVDDVRVGDTLDYLGASSAVDTETEGVWLVVDLTAIDRLTTMSFAWVTLEVGPRTFQVFGDQPAPDMTSFGADVGIPYQGALVIELPRDALDGPGSSDARLVFRSRPGPVAESAPVAHMDLTRLTVEQRLDVSVPTVLSFDEADLS